MALRLLLVALVLLVCAARAADPIDTPPSFLPIGNVTVTKYWRKIYTRAVPALVPRLVRVLGVAFRAVVNDTNLSGIASWNAINIVVSNFQQVGVYFGFFSASASGQISTDPTDPQANLNFAAAEAAVAVRYLQLVEFTDVNGQPGYQRGVDAAVSTYDLSSTAVSRWKNLANSTHDVVNNNLNTTKTLWAVPIESFDGVFRARVIGVGGPLALGNDINTALRIDSATVKVDIQLKYYNSPNATNGTSSVALCFAFGARASAVSFNASSSDPNNPTLAAHSFQSGNMTLAHGFQPTASVTTGGAIINNATVYFDSFTDADASQLALFPTGWTVKVACASWVANRPTLIYWDPIITMTNTPNPDPLDTPAPTSAAPQAAVGAIFVFVAALMALLF